MIKIIDPGLQASIQDLGRPDQASAGLARSGALDPWSLQIANLLLGNKPHAAVLEFAGNRFTLCSEQDISISVAGYNSEITICRPNQEPCPASLWQAMELPAGTKLEINSPNWSTRRYLAIQGGFRAEALLGSFATDSIAHFGGHKGRFLLKGDKLEANRSPDSKRFSQRAPKAIARPFSLDNQIRAIPGPEANLYGEHTLLNFWQARWQTSPQSNRMGCRLLGKSLFNHDTSTGSEEYASSLNSHAVLPGTVQLPSNGLPVILLADAQTTGGYPRIAKVIEADLWKLAHIPVGEKLSFIPCEIEEAVLALKQRKQYLYRMELATANRAC